MFLAVVSNANCFRFWDSVVWRFVPSSQAVKLQTRPIWVCFTCGGDDLNKFLNAFI